MQTPIRERHRRVATGSESPADGPVSGDASRIAAFDGSPRRPQHVTIDGGGGT